MTQWFWGYVRSVEYICVLLGCLASVTYTKAIEAFSITRTVSLVSLWSKQNNSQVKQNIFTACFISGTTNRQKFGGSGGYTLENFFSMDLHELKKQPKTKVGGGNLPFLPPPGGATEYTHYNKQNKAHTNQCQEISCQ